MSQGEQSIWGTINTALEVALNIYYLACENGSGIKMSAATASQNAKLKEFIEMGDRDGDDLYFPEGSPIYQKVREAVEQAEAERQAAAEVPPPTPTAPAPPSITVEEQGVPNLEEVREAPAVEEDAEADEEDGWDGLEP